MFLYVRVCVCAQSSQCMWLMQALGFLLSALPEEEVLVRLHCLITPHIQQLDALAQQEVRLLIHPHKYQNNNCSKDSCINSTPQYI